MATRTGRLERNDVAEYYTAAKGYKVLFAALFCAAVRIVGIENRDGWLTDDYIIGTLYEDGSVAYHKPTATWWRWVGVGTPNAYGEYEKVRLFSPYKTGVIAKRGDVVLLDANSEKFGVARFVGDKCETLAEFDAAINQNLDAVKDMSVIVADNEAIAGKLKRVDALRRMGRSVATISRRNKDGGFAKLEILSTGAEFKIDKLQDARRKLYEELLHIVGVDTAFEKGERMITSEAEMQGAETSAYIRIMIDTFNAQAQEQGAPFRLERVRKSTSEETAQKTGENNEEQQGGGEYVEDLENV